jgi:hypothetical protein
MCNDFLLVKLRSGARIYLMARQSEAPAPAMQTEASKTRSLEIAFLVDAEHLRQLENVLRQAGDSLEYQVKFSDGHTVQYHDIEDVLRQPNSQTRSIVSLIAGVTGRGKQSAYVVLKDKPAQSSFPLADGTSTSPSAEYTVNGTQKNVIYIGDKLDEWTAGIRQWYSVFDHGVPLLLLFGAIIVGPIWLWNNASSLLFSPTFLKSHSWLQGTTVVSLWVGIYWLFKLFPRATFAIGQGARRHQFFTYLRTAVLGTFILSVMASVLANWLTRHT